MNDELLTVAEFAKRAGVSKQAIYSRLDKGLKQFVQVVDGQKMLNIKALQQYNSKEVEQEIQSTFSSVEQEIQENQSSIEQPCTTLDLLNKTIETLQKQLDEKDKQIQMLTEALKTEQLHASQAQALHAGTIQQAIDENLNERQEPKKIGFFQRIFVKKT